MHLLLLMLQHTVLEAEANYTLSNDHTRQPTLTHRW